MEQVIVGLIGAGVTLAGGIVGYLFRSLSGEQRALVRGKDAEAEQKEANAATEYAKLARDTARDLRDLREDYEKQVEELRAMILQRDDEIAQLRNRVDVLEKAAVEKDRLIMRLEAENQKLRRKKGLAMQ